MQLHSKSGFIYYPFRKEKGDGCTSSIEVKEKGDGSIFLSKTRF